MSSNKKSIQDWSFTQVGGGQGTEDGEWLQTTQFPTTVQVELIKSKRIPDPYVGLNEWDVQWISESEWTFKSTFEVTESELSSPNVDLVFEGLDTYAIVTLNGHKLTETNNAFVEYRVSAKEHLKTGPNELLLAFPSTYLKGKEIESKLGKLAAWNGDESRLYIRKPQYNYGWDWGLVLLTVGPWRPIYLHTYHTRIAELRVQPSVSESLTASLELSFDISNDLTAITTPNAPHNPAANIRLLDASGKKVALKQPGTCRFSGTKGSASFTFGKGNGDEDDEVELWWPVGYGKQALYTIEVEVVDDKGLILDTQSKRIGFRRARVVQEPFKDGEPGLTFLFEINNVRIFCGGSNWIPCDNLLNMVSSTVYKEWLQLAVDGNQNMVRVWGGGIYEPDMFYDICDELGLLVWQDFMFGCGQYPAHDDFVENVKLEATQNVKRLRHHASLVIFAGNNEDYQVAEQLHLELDYADETSDFRKTTFPARYIYERTLPEVVEAHCDVHYHRSSPYSGQGKPTTDQTLGDLHQWNVWHGSQEPWHNWDKLAGRFVSEFGMQGYPNIRTVDYWLGGDKAERYPQSRTMVNHNKATGFERRLELYLMENFKHAFDMESYVYYTQIMQAETLAAAYRLWRRNWRGHGREHTAGALVWQLNDSWPVVSWSIVDYFLRPKPAYFTIARELRPYTVGMTRKDVKTPKDPFTAAYFSIDTILEIWGTNSTLEEKKVTLDVTVFDVASDWTHAWKEEVVLSPNASTELFKGVLPGQPTRFKDSEVPKTLVVSARLLDGDGSILSRYSNWPEPFKYAHFPAVDVVNFRVTPESDGVTLTLTTAKPVKGIILEVDGDEDVKWSDQAIDLVPNDPQTVKAVGLNGRQVKARYLGDGTA